MNTIHRGFILRELIKRDFQSRYAGSALGAGWSILHPFWQMVLFTFVFGLVMRIPVPAELTKSFAVFLFAGLVPWIAMQEGISRSANALTDSAALIKKLRFPPELLVVSNVVGALIQSSLALVVLLVVLIWRQEISVATLPWLLVVLPIQISLTLGLGLIFASLNVFLRDVSQFLSIFLNAWFYVTPIVYPLTLVSAEDHPRVRGLIEANPLTVVVQGYRYALMGGGEFRLLSLPILAVVSGLFLLGGWLLFKRLEPGFADEL